MKTVKIDKARQSRGFPSDINAKGRKAIHDAINPVVADTFALYVKTKSYHWHLSGAHYRDYHLLFDEQAEELFSMIDELAERVRKLGGKTIHSISDIKRLQTLKDDNEDINAKEMLKRLMNDNKAFTTHLRSAHKVCSDHEDVATTGVLENYIDEAERRVWFLYETLRS